MEETRKYVVTSQTTRAKQERPDLCWMNIIINKLDRCSAEGENFYFECKIDRKVYQYFINGKELKEAFARNDIEILQRGKKTVRYSFYLKYAKGEIYDRVSESTGKCVCRLQPLEGGRN